MASENKSEESGQAGEASALTLEELDEFVIALLEALKGVDDTMAVAEVKSILITNELRELLLFVGISSKQIGRDAIFTWTEATEKKRER